MILLQGALPAAVPDNRLLFMVSVAVVASVVLFAAAVVFTLVRRSDRRRAEEEKLAAMGTATARILHQIKNPLQTIVLHADLLQDERMVGDPAVRGELAEAIVAESQRLVAMLEELSVYAAGSQRALDRQSLALDGVVRAVLAHGGGAAAGEPLRVSSERLEAATVVGDGYYLRQAIENLVRNAREAMAGHPDPRLEVTLQRDGTHAVLRVSDTGPGIDPARLERIFEPFVSTKGTGMGLGLAICREIVEAHGGVLEVESDVGVGTTFTLRIPLEHALPAGGGELALPAVAGVLPWS
jgi:two-component system, NtrC family, sensor histidine kinase HydH